MVKFTANEYRLLLNTVKNRIQRIKVSEHLTDKVKRIGTKEYGTILNKLYKLKPLLEDAIHA